MKKISRKNFSGLSSLASKAGLGGGSSSSSTAAAPPPAAAAAAASSNGYANGHSGGGILKRPTWADKVREKLPPLGENEYEVLWERGVLGVIFLESEKDGIPYVSKATESCISPLVHAGDVLKFVNVVRSNDHSFSEFFKILATMKKPVLLRFERPASSTTSSDGEDSPLDQRASSAIGMGDRSFPDSAGAKMLRSNSVPQGESSTVPKVGRSAFWRTVSAKEPPPVTTSASNYSNYSDQQQQSPPVQLPSPGYAPVKLQPAVSSPFTRGDSGGRASERIEQMQQQQQQQYGHIETKQYEVSPRDVYAEYAQQDEYYEYEVYWETGSLGLFFGEDRVTNRPVVTRSTPSANPVVQRMVAVNDTLVSANNVQSRDYSFEAFFARLQQMNKPVRLVFMRKVDASPAQSNAGPARGRKASVTVDSLTSPGELDPRHRSPKDEAYNGNGQMRRVPTPPHQLTIVEEQEPSFDLVAAGSRTPPESPVYARESVRESHKEVTSIGSGRNFKADLDIDTGLPPPGPSISRDPPAFLAASAPGSFTRRNNRSPLNLAGVKADIMSGGQPEPKRSSSLEKSPSPMKSPKPVSWESAIESSSSSLSDAQTKRPSLVPSPAHNDSRHSTSTKATFSQSMSSRSPAPSSHSVTRESAPAMIVAPELPPKRSPAPSPVAAAVRSSEAAVTESDTVLEEDQIAALNGIATLSPPPSPQRSAIQSLSDFDDEVKPVVANYDLLSPAVNEPTSSSPPSGEAHSAALTSTRSSSSTSTDKVKSFWEMAAEEEAEMQLLEETRLSAESAPGSAIAAEGSSDERTSEPVVLAAAAVVAAISEPEEVALGVELGVVADYELGVVVEATVPEAKPLDGAESVIVAFQGEPVDIQPPSPEESLPDIEDQPPLSATENEEEDGEAFMKSELASAGGKTELSDEDADVMLDAIDQDITADIDGNDMMPQVPKIRSSSSSSSSSASPFKANKATVHANLAKYKRKAKNSRPVVKLPALTEEVALTVPLVAPNAVNTTVQVRGRSKPKPSMLETPDSKTYLVKWKETRSIGLQLKEVRLAKGVFPLVTDVCQEPCCELLKHVCVGDVIVEINGRNTSLMGVKKTVNFLKTCSKTTLLKLRHGPAYVPQRVSAYV